MPMPEITLTQCHNGWTGHSISEITLEKTPDTQRQKETAEMAANDYINGNFTAE